MISPTLQSDASPQLIELMKQIEDRCDEWAEHLALVGFTLDVAVWGTLTQIIDLIEQQIQQFGHGSQQQKEAMINLGRAGARLLGEIRSMELPIRESWFRWTTELKEASRQAVLTAHNCEAFVGGLRPGTRIGERLKFCHQRDFGLPFLRR